MTTQKDYKNSYSITLAALDSAIAVLKTSLIIAAEEKQFDESRVKRDKGGKFAKKSGDSSEGEKEKSGNFLDKLTGKKQEPEASGAMDDFDKIMEDLDAQMASAVKKFEKSGPGKLAVKAQEVWEKKDKMKPEDYAKEMENLAKKNAVGIAGAVVAGAVGAAIVVGGGVALAAGVAGVMAAAPPAAAGAAIVGTTLLNPLAGIAGVVAGAMGAGAGATVGGSVMALAGGAAATVGGSILATNAIAKGTLYGVNFAVAEAERTEAEGKVKKVAAAAASLIPTTEADRKLGKAFMAEGKERMELGCKALLIHMKKMSDEELAAFVKKKGASTDVIAKIRKAFQELAEGILEKGLDDSLAAKAKQLQSMIA
jgi:hypothetical protein